MIGVEHSGDTLNAMYSKIEEVFHQFKPHVIINEGGTLTKVYKTKMAGIKANGELGLVKFLADQAGIQTKNGDEPFELEFKELAANYSRKSTHGRKWH